MEKISETVSDILGLKYELLVRFWCMSPKPGWDFISPGSIVYCFTDMMKKNNIDYMGPFLVSENKIIYYKYDILIDPWEKIEKLIPRSLKYSSNIITIFINRKLWGTLEWDLSDGGFWEREIIN